MSQDLNDIDKLLNGVKPLLPDDVFNDLQKQLKRKKPYEKIKKGFKNRVSEGGTHAHALMRNLLETKVDARHKHAFLVRSNTSEFFILNTEEDGEHPHTLDDVVSLRTNAGASAHQHVVRVPIDITLENGEVLKAGTILVTDKDGEHEHGSDMLETTNFDGAHSHKLKLTDELTVESMNIADFWQVFGPFDLSDVSPIWSASQIRDTFSGGCDLPIHKSYYGRIDAPEIPAWKKALAASFGDNEYGIEKEDLVIFKQDEVAEVIFDKKKFSSIATVKAKLKDLDYPDIDDIKDDKDSFTARINSRSKIKADTIRTLNLEDGVKANVGRTKESVAKQAGIFKQTTVQTLIFDKDKFNASQSTKWAKDNDFSSVKVDETGSSFRLRQRDPGDFVRLRTIDFKPGIKATIGPLKASVKKSVEPQEGIDPKEARILIQKRSELFGMKKSKDGKLFFEKGMPLDLDDYADPVNLRYSIDTIAKSQSALSRVRHHGLGAFEGHQPSIAIGHERIVRRLLKFGTSPELDKNNKIDMMLPDELFNISEEIEKEDFDRISEVCPNEIEICKKDDEKRLVTGIVLEPDVVDAQGDTITADEIQKAAHFFMRKSRTIGFRHSSKAKAELVESSTTLNSFSIDGPNGKQKVKKGTWVITVFVGDDKLWASVKKKDINAFSVGGFGTRQKIDK